MSTQTSIIDSLNLPQNHTDILLALIPHDATAAQILAKTKVSNGRIYRLLSELEDLGLISKNTPSGRGQATYSLHPFADHIHTYLQHLFRSQSQKMSSIINSLDALDRPDTIEVVHGSKADFDHHIENFLYRATWIKILHKHTSLPWFLYCFEEDSFLKIRALISHSRPTGSSSLKAELLLKRQAYLDAYQDKSVVHIMSHAALTEYLTLLKKNHISLDLKSNLKQYPHVQIYVIDKLHNPFSTYISEHTVLQPLFFPTRTDRLLLLEGKEITATYQDYFQKYLEDSTPIEKFL